MSDSPRSPGSVARATSDNGRVSPDTLSGSAKRGQRERLVDAMIELAAQVGYQALSVAQISSHAGVSSATFYEQFPDKESCLVAAYRTSVERVLGDIQSIPPASGWADIGEAAVGALLGALDRHPHAGRMLLIESRAAGPQMRKERQQALEKLDVWVEEVLQTPSANGEILDIPAIAVVGAVRSIVVRHFHTHAEDKLPSLTGDILAWLRAYAVPADKGRWSTSRRALLRRAVIPEVQLPDIDAHALKPLPRGRHGLPASVVARSQRTRLIYGTAEVMMAKGYTNATVTDIVAAAGVARDVFYAHFADKRDAFLEAQNHPTQYILDTCAAAYFNGQTWPERVWKGLQTLVALIAENPLISYLRLVECYAAGPAAVRRAEEITRSFTVFLEEGYLYASNAARLPRLSSQAVAGGIFEIIQRHIADDDAAGLVRRVPVLAYTAIAPFTGGRAAAEVLERLSVESKGLTSLPS
jgi:AcrR family transcriptional regulator